MRTLAILDVETSGVVPGTDHLLEVGVAIYSVARRSLVEVHSWLVSAPLEAVIASQAASVHGISPELIAEYGKPLDEVMKRVAAFLADRAPDVFAAYNAEFDRAWFPPPLAKASPWLCLFDDVEWPRPGSSRTLLAAAHRLGVQVGTLHRAADDVLLCAHMLDRCVELGVDVQRMLERAMRPKRRYRALVSYETNELAKTAGFRWSPEEKVWWKRIVPADLETLNLPFRVEEIA